MISLLGRRSGFQYLRTLALSIKSTFILAQVQDSSFQIQERLPIMRILRMKTFVYSKVSSSILGRF